MNKLPPHFDKLIAYADNALDAEERTEVENLLASNDEALAFLDQLKASDLPFKDSFGFLLDGDKKNETPVMPSSHAQQQDHASNNSKWLWPTSLVASLLLGVILTFFALNAKTENHNNWIVQVADYHLLYIRETVNHSHASPEEVKKLTHDLSTQLKSQITIPDLTAQNLDFKRGQILDSNGRTLVQLAYLPKNGRPVALCILKENSTDSLPKTGTSRGLPYVTWSKNGLSYVIIGAIDKADLNAAALSALSQMDNNS
ncbi:MAG: hypothetical protein L3J51_10770 [Cocleimonas sp.]|nr:hypothetical protein [Cocleimonas sp.]